MKIVVILFFAFLQINNYDFAKVYKTDIENLYNDPHYHVSHNSKTNIFKKFSAIDISKYESREKNNINNFKLIEWTSKNQKTKSIKRVTKCIMTGNGKCINFVGFKFVDKQNIYYYISVESQGLMEYSINNKDYHILHEAILAD